MHGTPDTKRMQRRMLWTLPPALHPLLLTHCLHTEELWSVGRKAQLVFDTEPSDLALHTRFITEAAGNNPVSRSLHRLLDRRYQHCIDQLHCYPSAEHLARHWKQVLDSGDIKASFWALITHPKADDALIARCHGEFFMRLQVPQHCSSQVADGEIRKLQRELSNLRQQSYAKTVRLEAQLRQQEHNLTQLKVEARYNSTASVSPAQQTRMEKLNKQLRQRLEWTEKRLAQREIQQTELYHQVAGLEEHLQELIQENTALKLHHHAALMTMATPSEVAALPNIRGKQILYVGGSNRVLPRLRHIVESHEGDFIHHDLDNSNNPVIQKEILSRADIVLCPLECMAQESCQRAKRHCRKYTKPFVPLATLSQRHDAERQHQIN